jgi:Fe-S cluster assembly iron-binding protein IscA
MRICCLATLLITLLVFKVAHLTEMRRKLDVAENDPLLIRMGVRSGGCSGMSYVMDVCQPNDVTEDVRVLR